jgi:hypothetical protein
MPKILSKLAPSIQKTLKELGFGPFHIQRLDTGLRIEPRLLTFLEEHVPYLTSHACNLSYSQISKISCQSNAIENLQAYIDYYARLQALGLNSQDIIDFVQQLEAQIIFPLLIQALPQIIDKNIPITEFKKFAYLLEYQEQLEKILPSFDIFSQLALNEYQFNFHLEQNLLDTAIDAHQKLTQQGFTNEQSSRILKSVQYQKHLPRYYDCILGSFPKLCQQNLFNIEALIALLQSADGIDKINALYAYASELLGYQFTRHELIHVVNHSQGVYRLETLHHQAPTLSAQGSTPTKIIFTILEDIKKSTGPKTEEQEMDEYLAEIDVERQRLYFEDCSSMLDMFSIFQTKKVETQELIERLDMILEDFNCLKI